MQLPAAEDRSPTFCLEHSHVLPIHAVWGTHFEKDTGGAGFFCHEQPEIWHGGDNVLTVASDNVILDKHQTMHVMEHLRRRSPNKTLAGKGGWHGCVGFTCISQENRRG